MFFSTRVDNPIGLDMSDLSVKLVQFRKVGSELQLLAYSDVSLPSGLISYDVIKNPKGLIEFLSDLFADRSHHRGKLHDRSVVVSVPESKAFVRVVRLPNLSAEELAGAVPLEAEQYIPLPPD